MKNDKILRLLDNIASLKYSEDAMRNVPLFEQRLAKELDVSGQEAMAMLGYLLTKDYVRIINGMGLVVNPSNEEVRELVDNGHIINKLDYIVTKN
jgi:Mn-dependent DtxR family transcriptional regulator